MAVSAADGHYATRKAAMSRTERTSQDRPAEGSERGKRLYVLYALLKTRPKITPQEVKDLLGWDNNMLATASADLERLIDDTLRVRAV